MWVEVNNGLGSVRSDELQCYASKFGKIWAFALGKSYYTLYMDAYLQLSSSLFNYFFVFICFCICFVAKPNPPLDVQLLAEANFSTSLMVTWKRPIEKSTMQLSYVIRYCQVDSDVWTEVRESQKQFRF